MSTDLNADGKQKQQNIRSVLPDICLPTTFLTLSSSSTVEIKEEEEEVEEGEEGGEEEEEDNDSNRHSTTLPLSNAALPLPLPGFIRPSSLSVCLSLSPSSFALSLSSRDACALSLIVTSDSVHICI